MSQPHLLIVDDDPTIRALVESHYRMRGFVCATARDGQEAVAVIESGRVDVMITDLEMPRLGGIELLRAVRESGVPTRCVVLTGYQTIAHLTACLREGAIALIAKPLEDFDALDEAVDQALEQMRRWVVQINTVLRHKPERAEAEGALEPRSDDHA